MKKIQYIISLAMAVVLFPGAALAGGAPDLAAEAVFLLDEGSGKVLYEKNADLPMFPASTTKIMTALLLLEHAELNEIILVGEEIDWIGYDSSTAKLKVGNRLTAAEIIYALLLPSGNDAAYTAAVFVARKASGFELMDIGQALAVFAGMMNERARELGARNTNFAVPDGYHTPEHVTTARDMALITLEARKHEFLCQAAAATEYYWQGRRWTNTNRLLRLDYPEEYYPWATGFKTGYTPEAGNCIVTTASGGGRDLLAVILNSPRYALWQDARTLLEYGFQSWRRYEMLVAGRQVFTAPVRGQRQGEPETVVIVAGETYADLFPAEDIARIQLNFAWARGVTARGGAGLVFKAPIRKGQTLGTAVINLDGEVLGEVELLAGHGVKGFRWWLPVGGAAAAAIGLLALMKGRRGKRQAAA